MKKIYLFLSGCLLLSLTVNANNINDRGHNQAPFIFIENGIEYAVFNNGEFDFNIIQRPSSNININTRNINLSFNTGHNYEPNIRKDRYGTIIQIERTPIFYDRFGKVNRIGSIAINYNYNGLISTIGNLNIYYNNHGYVYNRTGFINHYNVNYKPRYNLYKRPISKRPIAYQPKNTVKKYYNSRNYNNNSKSYHPYSSANNRDQQKANKEVQKQENKKKESYRENSNSYRRTSNSSDSKYVSTSNDNTSNNKKR